MYVCICNAFTCKDVKKVRDQGVSKSGQVYKKLGCSMQCGKCLETIDSLLKEQNDSDSICLLYTSPSPRDLSTSRMPSSA